MQVLCSLVSIYFDSLQLGLQKKKKKSVWNFSQLIQRYAQFSFFRKGSGSSFCTRVCVWFLKKNVSHVIIYFNWPNFIVWLPLLLEILENACITFICQPGCDGINFEVNLILLIEPSKKSRQKVKYLENEKSFWGGIKSIFHHF